MSSKTVAYLWVESFQLCPDIRLLVDIHVHMGGHMPVQQPSFVLSRQPS